MRENLSRRVAACVLVLALSLSPLTVCALAPAAPGAVVGTSLAMGRRPQRFVEQSTLGSTISTVGGILALGEYYANIQVCFDTASPNRGWHACLRVCVGGCGG